MKGFCIVNGFHVEPPPECVTRMSDANGQEPYPGFHQKFIAHRAAAVRRFSDGVNQEMAKTIEEQNRKIREATNKAELAKLAPPGTRRVTPAKMSEGDELADLMEQLKTLGFDVEKLPPDADAPFLRAIIDSIQLAMQPAGKETLPLPQPDPNGMFSEGRTRTLSADKRRSILEGTEMGRRILEKEKRAGRGVSTFSEGTNGLTRSAIEALSGTPVGLKRLRTLGIQPILPC